MEKESSINPASRRWVRLARLLLVLLLAAAFCWFLLPWMFELPPGLRTAPGASPVLLDRNGKAMRHLTADDFTRSAPVDISKIPQPLIDCTLAAEDKRFYSHHGIDVFASLRAAYDFVRNRRVVSGASTITQQLAKISAPPVSRNLKSKFFEAMAARRLEMSWEKNRILEAYFDRLDYGNLRISPTEAARFYFQKPLSDLSLGECALLAGLPQAPSRLDPLRNPEAALARREVVLDRLSASGKYAETAIAVARTEPLRIRPLRDRKTAPWLNRIPGGKLRVRATLDFALQKDIENIVREETAQLESANLRHAAVVVIENATGDIVAMVSSADWNDRRGGQIHGALSPRSPGSTLKPFTYLLSFRDLGTLPSSVVADVPTTLLTEQGLQLPENYDRKYRGPVTIRTALACSLNVPALRELRALGGPEPLHTFLGRLGISNLDHPPARYGLGLTLGNAPVRLLALTNAYATLARLGDFLPARLFMDEENPSPLPLVDPVHAWLVADILSDKAARAPAFASGGPLDLPFRCAVKTGTSSDFRDNWCVGFTPEFTVGVWAGNFENQPMKEVSGVSGAGPVFHRTLVRAHRDTPPTWYDAPDGVRRVRLDSRTGKRVVADDDRKHVVSDWLPPGVNVPTASPGDYDAEGKAKLTPLYRDWFESGQNLRRSELVLDDSPAISEPLEIHRPADGATFLLDPEMPGNGSRLRLLTNLPEHVTWTCETLRIEGTAARLEPGVHTLIATDNRDGSRHPVVITVKSL